MRVGIDVGGTNTDAVLVSGERVVHAVKVPTTADVTDGVAQALRDVLGAAEETGHAIQGVMIGTTHFTNAFVEGTRLSPTAVVRLGAPATRSVPPLAGWPQRLRAALRTRTYMCGGGSEVDGRELSPLDEDELRRVAADVAEHEIASIAIAGVFSPMNADGEQRAKEILQDALPHASITLSHEIGRLGLLERENAAIINASLMDVGRDVFAGFERAVRESGVEAPVFLTQNDGTLMSLEHARRYPVATFSSGPTNSMRGAALLSGRGDCAVVDIGGTTSDVGILQSGFPREAATDVEIAGVRTNFRMPDTVSVGVGGGSLVEGVEVGPRSVGYELTRRARVFGGETLTATDVAVAGGRAELGDAAAVRHLDASTVRAVLERVDAAVAAAVDRMKVRAGAVPVVVVGGGTLLLGSELEGASELIKPDHFAVANAVGAAIAEVGGEVDRVVQLRDGDRGAAIERAQQDAREQAVAAGARAGSIRIVDVEATPLAYLPGNAMRLRVKAVGELDLGGVPHAAHQTV